MVTERYVPFLDNIKAFAIFLVICYHSEVITNPILWAIISMCVPLFFCVNGYLMLRREYTLREIYKKQFKLLLIIVLWGLFASATGMIYHHEPLTVKGLLVHFYKMDSHYGNHMWFLCTLFIINVFNPFLYLVVSQKDTYRWGGYLMILFAVFTVVGISRFTWRFNPFVGWKAFSLLYYLLGFYLLKDLFGLKHWQSGKLLITFVCAWVLQSLINFALLKFDVARAVLGINSDIIFNQYSSPFVVVETVMLFAIIMRFNSSNRLILFVGKNSFRIQSIAA